MPRHSYRQNNRSNNITNWARQGNRASNTQPGQSRQNMRHTPNSAGITIPYNFVPLNDRVVEAPLYPGKKINNDVFKLNRYYDKLLNGYLDLDIETLTPVYIRDTLTHEELGKKQQLENQNNRYINPDFFSPAQKIRIPGSSLRGMVRTLVEIVSFGKFVNFDGNKKFFYRALRDKSLKLRRNYQSIMTRIIHYNSNVAFAMNCRAGYLIKKNGQYRIHPAQKITINNHEVEIFRVENNLVNSIVVQVYDPTYKIKKPIYFNYETDLFHSHSGGTVTLFYAKVNSVSDSKDAGNNNKGALIKTGDIKGKHMHHIILPPDDKANCVQLTEEIISDYLNDPYRRAVNLIDLIDKNPNESFPCYYVEDSNNNIIAFGHTPYFRLPYKHSINDFVPVPRIKDEVVDFADAIFGRISNNGSFSGRVFFEDAFLNKAPENQSKPAIPKILGEPKPTCFQNYLEQENPQFDKKGNINNLKDYNDNDAKLRGYKLYWHHNQNQINWKESTISIKKSLVVEEDKNYLNNYLNNSNGLVTQNSDSYIFHLRKIFKGNDPSKNDKLLEIIIKYDTQHTIITPIDKGAKFKGRIRFENLTEEELGALLFVLDLPEGCAHKIGMAKPLGLGSIKIKVSLYISNREKRYSSFKTEFKDDLKNNTDLNQYKNKFADFILKKINDSSTTGARSADDLWNNPRLQELKVLITFNNRLNNINYPGLDSTYYQSRIPLKKATKIKEDN